jgi:tetratricopeptide (TPR) repeat protein
METLIDFLYNQKFKNDKLSKELTILELPNLLALMEYTKQRGKDEKIADIAWGIEGLLQFLDRKQIFQHVVDIREKSIKGIKIWNHTKFVIEANQIERLIEKGFFVRAKKVSQNLYNKSLAAGGGAYPEAAYDIAMANSLYGRVLKMIGNFDDAITYFELAIKKFNDVLTEDAKRMAFVCLSEKVDCLKNLDCLDNAIVAYEESNAYFKKVNYLIRGVALGEIQLGDILSGKKQFEKALKMYESALKSFKNLHEPSSVSNCLHQMAIYQIFSLS